jgi:hypothetical protein
MENEEKVMGPTSMDEVFNEMMYRRPNRKARRMALKHLQENNKAERSQMVNGKRIQHFTKVKDIAKNAMEAVRSAKYMKRIEDADYVVTLRGTVLKG